jgi:hypothetical protein
MHGDAGSGIWGSNSPCEVLGLLIQFGTHQVVTATHLPEALDIAGLVNCCITVQHTLDADIQEYSDPRDHPSSYCSVIQKVD